MSDDVTHFSTTNPCKAALLIACGHRLVNTLIPESGDPPTFNFEERSAEEQVAAYGKAEFHTHRACAIEAVRWTVNALPAILASRKEAKHGIHGGTGTGKSAANGSVEVLIDNAAQLVLDLLPDPIHFVLIVVAPSGTSEGRFDLKISADTTNREAIARTLRNALEKYEESLYGAGNAGSN